MTGKLPFEKIERTLIDKRPAKTDSKFGGDPYKRSTEDLIKYGVVNVDKPKGPTSHLVSAYTKQILGLTKCGHSGTLDPGVTGVLAVALDRATRVVQSLLTAGKEYVCVMHLHSAVDEAKIREVCDSFVGRMKQLPPVKSAVKRQWRYRKIYYFDILEITEQDVLFVVGCQAGTYIRKLCHDIGEKLGVGGHMSELRRTKAGPFDESTCHSLQELQDAFAFWKTEGNDAYIRKIIQPMESAVEHLGKVYVLDSTVGTLCHGADLKTPGIAKVDSDIQAEEPIAIMTLKGELVALGTAMMISKEMIDEDKGLAVRVDKVFMDAGTYPKIPPKASL
ncbi:RNA-guided pseudouridylation complex pseudouridine synthase subunit Cbf5 [Candidatus Woesearchaeota archaeon]|jgi:H/ACA ribonucleoprotein complex subunit 4|nr:RNA-guided pseudouridylation complex pseudouridine synthase subunit Cbf5 [Candidatus Woesearchaeota archaeon]MBT3538163.1 RNA-guided pseudouridylation complex pseudouridine synthase subunit Cbf5 [Candidatus Woesearchaeota archaeon]MBT4697478.1 RNA-guided pseudouridylation complex pseudouridine synthase subunit Cbf5 [Candidatus Woesearchaeota archaeon]MBT4716878.1 RNA-guided pseudouridylation complex pseudouridine synthase subunit Cbf5 [Candidatus Woesearchaeota archaeon]MBT7105832.1 RNA-guid